MIVVPLYVMMDILTCSFKPVETWQGYEKYLIWCLGRGAREANYGKGVP